MSKTEAVNKAMNVSREFVLGNRTISHAETPLVIAEIGINHEGSLKVAKEMVDAAYAAGAEVIKHQTHVVSDEMTAAAQRVVPGNTDVSIFDVMERCALSENDEIELKAYVEDKGLIYLSTPFSRAAADRLFKMGVCGFKIGSGECNNLPLIEHIAEFGLPMIISTGMNNLDSVKQTVAVVEKFNVPYALLHTTNLYPTPSHLVRLGGMQELQRAFPNINIGLSDHTTGNYACFAAVALGATIVERHFTDSMTRKGPDIVNSMDPQTLTELIEGVTEIAKMRGGNKEAAQEETVTSNFAFATVVAIKPIKKGDIFSTENIWVKRPGTGAIQARHFNEILGKQAMCDIKFDAHLRWNDIGES
jgi:N-acetylneuraminate synthase